MNMWTYIALWAVSVACIVTLGRFSPLVYHALARGSAAQRKHRVLTGRLMHLTGGRTKWRRFSVAYALVVVLVLLDGFTVARCDASQTIIPTTTVILRLALILATTFLCLRCNMIGAELKTIQGSWFLQRPGIPE